MCRFPAAQVLMTLKIHVGRWLEVGEWVGNWRTEKGYAVYYIGLSIISNQVPLFEAKQNMRVWSHKNIRWQDDGEDLICAHNIKATVIILPYHE